MHVSPTARLCAAKTTGVRFERASSARLRESTALTRTLTPAKHCHGTVNHALHMSMNATSKRIHARMHATAAPQGHTETSESLPTTKHECNMLSLSHTVRLESFLDNRAMHMNSMLHVMLCACNAVRTPRQQNRVQATANCRSILSTAAATDNSGQLSWLLSQ